MSLTIPFERLLLLAAILVICKWAIWPGMSWWLVTAPIWFPFACVGVILAVVLAFACLALLIGRREC